MSSATFGFFGHFLVDTSVALSLPAGPMVVPALHAPFPWAVPYRPLGSESKPAGVH